MEKLRELSAQYQQQFSELRFFQGNKCVKVIGDTVYGFEFIQIRGQYKVFFVAYSLWGGLKKSGFESCLFFREVCDLRGLQIPFVLPKVERDLERLITGAVSLIKPPLSGDIEFDDIEVFVNETVLDKSFQAPGWDIMTLLQLAIRTSSFCGQRSVAQHYLAQLVDRLTGLSSRHFLPAIDRLFGGDQSWQKLLEKEIEIGLAGNQTVKENREILKKKGLVISDIVITKS